MAIQRIERYGKFQPSPIDESRVRRMEQLAGLAGGIAQTARAFGEARAAEEAPEKAQAAVEEAIKTDPETGEVTFGELPEGRGYGKEVFNQAALKAYDAKANVAKTQKFIDLVNDNKDDPQAFLEQANEYTNAFLAYDRDYLEFPEERVSSFSIVKMDLDNNLNLFIEKPLSLIHI